MESIRNVINSASRTDSTTTNDATGNNQPNESEREPVSGETGNTAVGEPYDAGNSGNSTNTERTAVADNNDTVDSSTSDAPSSGVDQMGAPGNTPATAPVRSEHETEKTGVTSANKPSNISGSHGPSSSNESSGPGPEPSVGADPTSAAQPTQKQQGADRPTEEPNSDEHQRILEAKKEAEDAQSTDTSGPGPKPLSETQKPGSAAHPSTVTQDDDGPQKESQGTGTGEKYVKSSGMKADGGDFDAANPGAGKEADRLLESKGIHRDPGAAPSGDGDDKPDPLEEKLNKPSIGEKVKAKLHTK